MDDPNLLNENDFKLDEDYVINIANKAGQQRTVMIEKSLNERRKAIAIKRNKQIQNRRKFVAFVLISTTLAAGYALPKGLSYIKENSKEFLDDLFKPRFSDGTYMNPQDREENEYNETYKYDEENNILEDRGEARGK